MAKKLANDLMNLSETLHQKVKDLLAQNEKLTEQVDTLEQAKCDLEAEVEDLTDRVETLEADKLELYEQYVLKLPGACRTNRDDE